MRVHLCLGQESPQALCPSLCSHLRAPCLLEWWQLGHLWRALTLMQCRTQCTIWMLAFLPHKNPEPKNLQIALLLRGLCIFPFPSLWSIERQSIFFILIQHQKELAGYALAKWEKKTQEKTFFDFQLLSINVFFPPLVPFPVHDAIQTITSFIWTVGESASSFSSCMSHVTLPIFRKAAEEGGWEFLPGLRALVLETLCPVVLWSLTSWTDVQNQWPTSHSWYCWRVQNRQIHYCF